MTTAALLTKCGDQKKQTMTDELADRLDSLADETTRAADALLMREAAATIRAERVAPDHQAVTLTIRHTVLLTIKHQLKIN